MIELKHLTKKYDHFLAVEDLNLKIETGEFFGLWDRMVPEKRPPSECSPLSCFRLRVKSGSTESC